MQHLADQKYTNLQFRLAELLDWQPFLTPSGSTHWVSPVTNAPAPLPNWVGDDGDAFRLMVDLGLKVDCTDTDSRFIGYVHTTHRREDGYVCEHQSDHYVNEEHSKRLAIRFAIARAAILKLEAQLAKKPAADIAP